MVLLSPGDLLDFGGCLALPKSICKKVRAGQLQVRTSQLSRVPASDAQRSSALVSLSNAPCLCSRRPAVQMIISGSRFPSLC